MGLRRAEHAFFGQVWREGLVERDQPLGGRNPLGAAHHAPRLGRDRCFHTFANGADLVGGDDLGDHTPAVHIQMKQFRVEIHESSGS